MEKSSGRKIRRTEKVSGDGMSKRRDRHVLEVKRCNWSVSECMLKNEQRVKNEDCFCTNLEKGYQKCFFITLFYDNFFLHSLSISRKLISPGLRL